MNKWGKINAVDQKSWIETQKVSLFSCDINIKRNLLISKIEKLIIIIKNGKLAMMYFLAYKKVE